MTFDELKEFAASLVKSQMMQYGQQPDPEQIDGIVSNILKNQDETRKVHQMYGSGRQPCRLPGRARAVQRQHRQPWRRNRQRPTFEKNHVATALRILHC